MHGSGVLENAHKDTDNFLVTVGDGPVKLNEA
jgi:hypothetical protein